MVLSAATSIERLAGLRVLVVGDISLDEYLYGRPTRLSREAPVPVLEHMRRECILGAAANPARNIVTLGSSAIQVSVVGDDREGTLLCEMLQHETISHAGVISVDGRPTTTKTRILAHEPPRLPQHVARIDRIERSGISPADESRLLAMLTAHIPHVDVVLCSDYQLGLLSSRVVDTVRHLCRENRVLLTVDAQGNSHYYREVDLFRCNNIEASSALGTLLQSEDDYRWGLAALQSTLAATLVIVTRGPDGLSWYHAESGYFHVPAVAIREVYDTTGAGDTFIAVATLALAARLEPHMVVLLANAAAALTVRKFGNAVVTPAELAEVLQRA